MSSWADFKYEQVPQLSPQASLDILDMRDEKDESKRSKLWKDIQEVHRKELREIERIQQKNIGNFTLLVENLNADRKLIGRLLIEYSKYPGFHLTRAEGEPARIRCNYFEATKLNVAGAPAAREREYAL